MFKENSSGFKLCSLPLPRFSFVQKRDSLSLTIPFYRLSGGDNQTSGIVIKLFKLPGWAFHCVWCMRVYDCIEWVYWFPFSPSKNHFCSTAQNSSRLKLTKASQCFLSQFPRSAFKLSRCIWKLLHTILVKATSIEKSITLCFGFCFFAAPNGHNFHFIFLCHLQLKLLFYFFENFFTK